MKGLRSMHNVGCRRYLVRTRTPCLRCTTVYCVGRCFETKRRLDLLDTEEECDATTCYYIMSSSLKIVSRERRECPPEMFRFK